MDQRIRIPPLETPEADFRTFSVVGGFEVGNLAGEAVLVDGTGVEAFVGDTEGEGVGMSVLSRTRTESGSGGFSVELTWDRVLAVERAAAVRKGKKEKTRILIVEASARVVRLWPLRICFCDKTRARGIRQFHAFENIRKNRKLPSFAFLNGRDMSSRHRRHAVGTVRSSLWHRGAMKISAQAGQVSKNL